MVHVVPRAPLVDRVERLAELARGRRVAHLGFVDAGRMEAKAARREWLHERLAATASALVGIDYEPEGVERARGLGFEAYAADCRSRDELAGLGLEPFDLVVAGELIEHVDAPGALLDALEALLRPGGELVVTTPNAHALTNFGAALLGRELVNDDHVCWYSWRTLVALLERHGWETHEVAFYALRRERPSSDLTPADRAKVRAFMLFRSAARPLLRVRPALADGLLVRAHRRG